MSFWFPTRKGFVVDSLVSGSFDGSDYTSPWNSKVYIENKESVSNIRLFTTLGLSSTVNSYSRALDAIKTGTEVIVTDFICNKDGFNVTHTFMKEVKAGLQQLELTNAMVVGRNGALYTTILASEVNRPLKSYKYYELDDVLNIVQKFGYLCGYMPKYLFEFLVKWDEDRCVGYITTKTHPVNYVTYDTSWMPTEDTRSY
jgi:hypothetical protein